MADTETQPVTPAEEQPTSPVETPAEGEQPETPTAPVAPSTETPEGTQGDEPANPNPAPAPEPEKKEVDWKEKFSSSARRNQVVEAQYEALQNIVRDITKEDRPTDDEMRSSDPDWDIRSDFEKNLAIKTEALSRANKRADLEMLRIKEEGKRKLEVAKIIDSEPRLKGKEDAFEAFASDPRNSMAPANVLLNAFLFDAGAAPVTPSPSPAAPVPSPVPTLGRGNPSGGRPPAPRNPGERSPEELKALRKHDPKAYNEAIRKGEIK